MKGFLRWFLFVDVAEAAWRDMRANLNFLDRLLGDCTSVQEASSSARQTLDDLDEASLLRWRRNAVAAFYLWGVAGLVGAVYMFLAVVYGSEGIFWGRVNAFLFGVFACLVGLPRSYQAARDIDAIDRRLLENESGNR